MKRCAFCPNPRTAKRGEHIWDDWLNRQDGIPLRYDYEVTEYGADDAILREYPTRQLSATKPVVCDRCNNEWMSDVSNHAKNTLEGFIRYERPATMSALDIVIFVTFAVMKSIVLDYSAENDRRPIYLPLTCARFRQSLTAPKSESVVIPRGVQVWMGAYRRTREVEARFWINGLIFKSGRYAGFHILMITYAIGAFVFQLTYPRWTRFSKPPSDWPFITQARFWDDLSVPVWPDVDTAHWPPTKYLDNSSLEDFHKRFGIGQMLTRV